MDNNRNNESKKEDSTTAILALVFSFIFAPAGLILGIIALKKNQSKGLSITSIILSGLGSLILFFIFILIIIGLLNPQTTPTTIQPTQSELDKKAAEEIKKQAEAEAANKKAAEDRAAAEAAAKLPKTKFGDGTYLVGAEIQSGTYKNSSSNGCYYERLSGLTGSLDEILSNDNPSGPAIVEILSSDKAFKSQRCGIWEKIG